MIFPIYSHDIPIYIYNQLYCETDGWCLRNHPKDDIPMWLWINTYTYHF